MPEDGWKYRLFKVKGLPGGSLEWDKSAVPPASAGCSQTVFWPETEMKNFSVLHKYFLYDLLGPDLPYLLWKGIEPCHQVSVLLLGQLSCFFSGPRPYKSPGLKAFIEKKESCSFPKKPFDPVTSLPAEQKKDVLFIRVQIIFGSDDLRQAVDPQPTAQYTFRTLR